MVKSRKRKSRRKLKKTTQKGSKFVEDFIKDLEKNKKIRIIEKIYGKKAVNLTKKLFSGLDSDSQEAKEWMQNWSNYQKSRSALIVYERKKLKNKVIGFKLAIGTGDNVSVTGEEHSYEKGLQILENFRGKKRSKLIEICCKCGFIHRDDRHPPPMNKQRKLHYHWSPERGEVVKNGIYRLPATICVSCAEGDKCVNWKIYNAQRKNTPQKYFVASSFNATLPAEYLNNNKFDELYSAQAEYFEVEE